MDQGVNRRAWKKEEDDVIRIDHSDVYFENERLEEDLEYSLNTIHRSRYRQVMARDTEIHQLKESLALMRQSSNVGSVLNGSSKAKTKTKTTATTTASVATKRSEATSGNGKKKSSTEKKATSGCRGRERTSSSVSKANTISILMPSAESSGNDNDDDFSDDDDSGNGEDTRDTDGDDDGEKGNKGKTQMSNDGHSSNTGEKKTETRKSPAAEKSSHQSKLNSHRPKSCPAGREPCASVRLGRQSLNLEAMMAKLRIDQIPQSWYTKVVPASDVSTRKRSSNTKNRSGTDAHFANRRYLRGKSQRTPQRDDNINNGRKEGKIPFDGRFPGRPHTSLGVSGASLSAAPSASPSASPAGTRSAIRRGQKANDFANTSAEEDWIPAENDKSSLVCHQLATSSKTVRQLKQIQQEQEHTATLKMGYANSLKLRLAYTRDQRTLLDGKIRAFLDSLEQVQKAERWKNQGFRIEAV